MGDDLSISNLTSQLIKAELMSGRGNVEEGRKVCVRGSRNEPRHKRCIKLSWWWWWWWQHLKWPRLTLNWLCGQGWSWTCGLLASSSQGLENRCVPAHPAYYYFVITTFSLCFRIFASSPFIMPHFPFVFWRNAWSHVRRRQHTKEECHQVPSFPKICYLPLKTALLRLQRWLSG